MRAGVGRTPGHARHRASFESRPHRDRSHDRAAPGTSFEDQISSGYLTEQYVIDTAKRAGFRLASWSEANANPKDTKDHPKGVWTLPPTLALGDEDREKYLAIGESDRMTLKFVKP